MSASDIAPDMADEKNGSAFFLTRTGGERPKKIPVRDPRR